jgi:hypothetical protein
MRRRRKRAWDATLRRVPPVNTGEKQVRASSATDPNPIADRCFLQEG